MKFFPTMSLFVSMSVLAACGGGTTGSNAFTATGPITIANLNEAGESFFDSALFSDVSSINGENVAALTAKGSASYAGFMFAEPDDSTDVLVGRARINANFADGGSLTGGVTDLVLFPEGAAEVEGEQDDVFEPIPADTNSTPVAGSLALSDGSIETVDGVALISIDVAGNMTIPAASLEIDADETFDVSGEMVAFVADTGDFLAVGGLDAEGPNLTLSLDALILAK